MRVYLDHNAATPVDPRVLERFVQVEREVGGNPASLHSAGRRANAVLEQARSEVAEALGVEPDDVVFTAGGTESNNTIAGGAGVPELPVLLSDVEHPSVLRTAELRGTVRWQVDETARAVPAAVDRPFGLVMLCHAQSEVGTVQRIEAARAIAAAAGVPLHVDACQSLGKIPVREATELADSVALSPHKAGGLRGAGLLVVRKTARLRPLLLGGAQERGLRAGTQSPALAAATALAVRLAVAEQHDRAAAMREARDAFEAALLASVDGVSVLGDEPRLPNTTMVLCAGVDGRSLLPALDLAGVEASAGAACSSGSPSAPAVLTAMGLNEELARSCVRFSLSHETPRAIAMSAAELVAGTVHRMRNRRASRA